MKTPTRHTLTLLRRHDENLVALRRALACVLANGGWLAADKAIVHAALSAVWSSDTTLPGPHQLYARVLRLVRQGELELLYIGKQAHFSLARDRTVPGDALESEDEETSLDDTTLAAPSVATSARQKPRTAESPFELGVQIDLLTERMTMYRVAVVVEALVALLLVRDLVLLWLEL